MYDASNPKPSAHFFPETSPAYAAGVTQCDTIVHNFHRILLAGNSNLNEAENYFSQQQQHLTEHMAVLDDLHAAILEEKRCLESQMHECRTQVQQARDNKRVILSESDKLMQHLTSELAHLEEDEEQLNTQHAAVDDRIAEMNRLMEKIDEQIASLNTETSRLRAEELSLARDERHLEEERADLRSKEYELEERLVRAERQDEAIALWTKNLDNREGDTAKVRQILLQRLKEIEAEERGVGIDGKQMLRMNKNFITIRRILDDFEMTIERDVECEEIDTYLTDEEDYPNY